MEFDLDNVNLSHYDLKRGLIIPKGTTLKLAYFCGIIIGDGCIYISKTKNDISCAGHRYDEEEFYKEVISPLFNELFGFYPKLKIFERDNTIGFKLGSKGITSFLIKQIGFPPGKKCDSMTIPIIFKESLSLELSILRGIFDTDGCICFKKRYRNYPYYPVITIGLKNKALIKEIAQLLQKLNFKIVELYDYKKIDPRAKLGYTIINKVELNGKENLKKWMNVISSYNPKHLKKIKKYWKE